MVQGLATCSPRVQQPKAQELQNNVLVLTVGAFSCTASVVARLVRAYTQATSAGFLVQVLLISRTGESHSEAEAELWRREDIGANDTLRAALGPGAVHEISLSSVRRAFPHVLLTMRAMRWHDKRRPRWLANACDLPALVWWKQMRSVLPSRIEHMWVLQHDVGWSGSLPTLLNALDRSEPLKGRDLLCDTPERAKRTWLHFHERNYLADDEVWTCLLAAVRLSRRLLNQLVFLLSARGNQTAYCEVRAASECARAKWCRPGNLRLAGGLLGVFSYDSDIDDDILEASSAAVRPIGGGANDACGVGKLFHKVT